MAVPRQVRPRSLLLTPRGPLAAGGSAETFQSLLARVVHEGHRHLLVDLSAVDRLDEAGARAIARGATEARRVGARFTIAAPSPAVRAAIASFAPGASLEIAETREAARRAPASVRAVVLASSVLVLAASLVALGVWWPGLHDPLPDPPSSAQVFWFAATRILELVAAALIGFAVTAVHHRVGESRAFHASIEQAQVLLCVSGAMMMIIIGDSLARAFGMVGAAGIIRFRTPVEDPRDVTILFLLMGLGMASGIGALPVAGLGMLFLCTVIVVLDRLQATDPAGAMLVTVTADGPQIPAAHVAAAFARHGASADLVEASPGPSAMARYVVTLPRSVSAAEVDGTLLDDGHGIADVTWQPVVRET